MYVKDIQTGICAKDGEPVVEKESAGTALVDGKNLLGPVVGNFCMNLAIKKAKEAGIGWVVARGGSWPSRLQWVSLNLFIYLFCGQIFWFSTLSLIDLHRSPWTPVGLRLIWLIGSTFYQIRHCGQNAAFLFRDRFRCADCYWCTQQWPSLQTSPVTEFETSRVILRLTVACLGDLTPTQQNLAKPLRFRSSAVLVWEHPDPV